MPGHDYTSATSEVTQLTNARKLGLVAGLLERCDRWRRGAPLEMDCDLCSCPTGKVVHHIVLCPSCNPEWPEMKRRMFGWRRM